MKTVTLEQLDPSTSAWLREASRDEPVTITDHGTPIITLTPVPPALGRTVASPTVSCGPVSRPS